MKTKVLSLVAIFLIGTMAVFAQSKTEKFKAYGSCGMCTKRIEKAAMSVDGVTKVNWDKKTNMLEVSFDSSKTNVHKVHMAVATVGHDTDMHKAPDAVYNKLPRCCKYDRPKAKTNLNSNKEHNH